VIFLDGVSKSFGNRRVLEPTTLTVEPRRSLALLGPSGSGKSTLLRLVLGLIRADTGRITIGGEPMAPETARPLRLKMGYVIQDGGLFPHMTARENVNLMAVRLGWTRDRTEARTAELARLVDLSPDLLLGYPSELSGGQRQRVGLMRALMLDPEVLLLDEPLGALDPMIRARLQDDLKRIFRELQKTVLFVTHDLAEAAYLGDEIALMHGGAIEQRGPFRELLDRPATPFVSEFLHAERRLWDTAGARS
jgi:osmoprotectant transport system ATP-binding protein